MRRQKPWTLERAELALRHEASLQAERDRADAEVSRARLAQANARQDALSQLTAWAMQERDLVKHVFDHITEEMSRRAGREIAERIRNFERETEPMSRQAQQIRSAMLTRAKVDTITHEVDTAVVRLRIPAVELNFAHGFSRLDDYPWAGRRSVAQSGA